MAATAHGREASQTTRRCAVTRTVASCESLIRFVAAPDDVLVPDLAQRLPGRGVWVSCARQTVADAVKTNAFARSLKRRVIVSEDLPERVELLLAKRVRDALALANKAGLVLTGFGKVEAAIAKGKVAVLIHAANASGDGYRKLAGRIVASAAQRGVSPEAVSVVRGLNSDELSLALGRPNVVHAAMATGGVTRKFLSDMDRLCRYRIGTVAGVAA